VVKFDTTCTTLASIGGSGSGNGLFMMPYGAAGNVDGDKVYVADTGNDLAQMFAIGTPTPTPVRWARSYGGNGGSEIYASSVITIPGDGYLVVGTTESFGAGGKDA